MTATPLDLRTLPAEEHAAALARAFDALAPEDELLLITPGDPRALLKGLIAERWGRFVWTPLHGHGAWRGALTKRAAGDPPTISAWMEADHRRCDALYAEADAAAEAGDAPAARAHAEAFVPAMRRHMEVEEQVLFPPFERRMHMQGAGPTAVMRAEHDQVRGLLEQIALSAADGDLHGLRAAGETLLILMEQHNYKEEEMLYRMMDEVLGDQADALLQQAALR